MRDRVTMSTELLQFTEVLRDLGAQSRAAGGEEQDRGVTSGELADALGWSESRVLKYLHQLQEKGRLCAGRAFRPTLAGFAQRRVVYYLNAEENGHVHEHEPAHSDQE